MHKLLNDYLTVEDESPVQINFTDVQQLKHFAVEAEMNQNYDLAAYYYQEVCHQQKKLFYYSFYKQQNKFRIQIDIFFIRELHVKKTTTQIGSTMQFSIYSLRIHFEPKNVSKKQLQ